jgi:putative phosphotransacetylase
MIKQIPVEISARHIHLSKNDFEKLFGKSKDLHLIKNLSQEGEFASDKKVEIINEKEKLNLRIVGPFREKSQIEISLTDAYQLKLNPLPELRISGDINGTLKVLVKGPKSSIKIPAIIAKRHLHCSREDGKKLKLKDAQIIKIKIPGKRGLIFDNVVVRIKHGFKTSLHLDTDEANAAGINASRKTFGEIVK